MDEEYPNVLIVNELPETPEEIIDGYLAEIIEKKDDHEELLFILQDFYDEVSIRAEKQYYINQAKACLQQLEDLHVLETEEFIDEEDLDD